VTAAGTQTGKLAVAYGRSLIAGREKVEPKELNGETALVRTQLAKLSPEDANSGVGARVRPSFASSSRR
jgi:hypothetical protein